ncbi:MAG: DnaA regulatory inactivator Hda [Gammaproteobacteria bacterium]
MNRQLTLGIQLSDNIDFSNFLEGKNSELVTVLKTLPAARLDHYVYVQGAKGAGKSHLLQASCRNTPASIYLPLREFRQLAPEILDGLERSAQVCLDDIDAIAGNSQWEEAIFHCFNRLRENKVSLVISSTLSPTCMKLTIPDLQSRLQWGTSYTLERLLDSEQIEALQLRATQRGFDLPNETAGYLLKRVSRQMTDLFDLLDALDIASLSAQRKLTVPFVKTLLGL